MEEKVTQDYASSFPHPHTRLPWEAPPEGPRPQKWSRTLGCQLLRCFVENTQARHRTGQRPSSSAPQFLQSKWGLLKPMSRDLRLSLFSEWSVPLPVAGSMLSNFPLQLVGFPFALLCSESDSQTLPEQKWEVGGSPCPESSTQGDWNQVGGPAVLGQRLEQLPPSSLRCPLPA